jgi:hypothetical protein
MRKPTKESEEKFREYERRRLADWREEKRKEAARILEASKRR